jgi:cell wall-associated NlpC family hydrolase
MRNADLQARMQEIGFNKDKTLKEEAFEFTKSLVDAEYDYKLAKANEIQAVQLRLEKQLAASRLDAAKAVENALLRMQEARLRTTVAEQKAVAAKAADALAPDQPSNLVGPVAARLGTAGGTLSAPILPTERSNSVQRLLQAANKNLGLFAGSTERCADAIRVLFKETGIAIGVTKQAWDGLESGSRLASGFFGSDIGQRITRQEDLRPGDLVGFERTYGNWGPGVQTHVGMYAGEGMMYDHSSRKGLVRRPMSTFAGKFMYGVRPAALGGAGVATPGTEAPLSGTAFSTEKRAEQAEDARLIAQSEEDATPHCHSRPP